MTVKTATCAHCGKPMPRLRDVPGDTELHFCTRTPACNTARVLHTQQEQLKAYRLSTRGREVNRKATRKYSSSDRGKAVRRQRDAQNRAYAQVMALFG